MVQRRTCSFCGNTIEPGTGKMFIRKDGTVFYFCSNKCHKNLLKLKRIPRRVKWTRRYEEEKKKRKSTLAGRKAKAKKSGKKRQAK